MTLAHLRAAVLHAVIVALASLRDRLNHWLYALNRAEQDANFECRCPQGLRITLADRLILIICLCSLFPVEALPVTREERHAIETRYEACIAVCRQSCLPKVVM